MRWDEAAFTVIEGAISGYLGGPGANYKGDISDVIDGTRNAISRASKRTNENYAKKSISALKHYRDNYCAKAFWKESFNYTTGMIRSDGLSSMYSAIRQLVLSWFE